MCTILFPVFALFVLQHNLNGYELHHQGEAQSSQYSVQTAFCHNLLFAGFLVPSCPKRALVWGMVVRVFARRDLCYGLMFIKSQFK